MNRYEIKKQINSGAFGSVFEAVDKENNNKVAIKKVHKKFYELNQKKKNREVKALNALSHPNIITLMDFVQKGNGLYFVFELMDYNLYEVIANRRGAPFPLSLIQFILKETLIGLNYLHNSGFFHRDIKPENILVSGNKVKIADFGLVRELNSGSKRLSKYVSTSWYRAPEVFFGSQSYDSSIDLWALGAIASELMTLKPLFPGKNDNDQIFLMCNVLGSPTESFSLGGKWTLGIQLASIHDIRFPKVEEGSLKSILQAYTYYDTACLQFIVSLLQYDPTLRLTAAEALDHPFFSFTYSNNNNQNVDLSISYPYFPKEITQIDFSNHSLELPNINGNGTISPFINGFISSSEEDLEEEEIIINNEINQQIELEDNFNLSYSSDKLSDPHSIIYNTNNNESSTLSMCFDYPQNETSSFCSLNNLPNLNQNQNQNQNQSNNDQVDEEDVNNNHKPVPFYLQKKEFQLFAPPPKFYHNEMEMKRLSINSKRISNNSSNKRRASEIYFNFDKHNQTHDTFDMTNNSTTCNYNRRHSLYDILDSSELATFPISLSNNEPKMVDSSTSPIKSPLRLKEHNKREKNHFRKPSKLVSGLRRMSNILSKEFINIKKGSSSGIYSNSNSSNNSNTRQHKRGLSLTIGNKEMSSSTTASLSPNINANYYKDNEFQQFIENTFSDIANDTTINRLSSSWDQFETHSDYLSMNNYNNYQYKTNLSLTNSQTTSRKNSNKKLNRKLSFKIKSMSPKSPNNNSALAFNLTSNYTKELDRNNNSNDKFFVTYSHPATPNKIKLKNQLNLNHSYDSTSTTTNHNNNNNNNNTLGYKGSIKKETINNDKKRKESINGLFNRIKLFFNSKKVN